jgi:hypothetical protein
MFHLWCLVFVQQHPFSCWSLWFIVNLGIVPFQQHLKITYDFFSLWIALVYFYLNNLFWNKSKTFKTPFSYVYSNTPNLNILLKGKSNVHEIHTSCFKFKFRHVVHNLACFHDVPPIVSDLIDALQILAWFAPSFNYMLSSLHSYSTHWRIVSIKICPCTKCIRMHDAICDDFTSIAHEFNFNMVHKQLHIFPCSTP